MITELTQEQIDLMPVVRDKWINIVLSTYQCSEEEGENAVRAAYRCAGIEPPSQIIWDDNPLEAVLRLYSARDSVWYSVRDSVMNSVMDSARDSVMNSVMDSVMNSVMNSVKDSVWHSARDSVWYSVRDSVMNSAWDSVLDRIDTYSWPDDFSFFDYFSAIGIVDGLSLQGLFECSKCFSWWWAFEDVAVVIRKPHVLHENENVIHCEDGPAIAWKGFEIWALDGYVVDQDLVLHPRKQTLDQIHSEENEEIKRIRIERYGWERYLTESNAQVLDVSVTTPPSGKPWMETLMYLPGYEESQSIAVLITYDPSTPHTGRKYALEVDPSCKTCADAQRYLLSPEVALDGMGIDLDKVEIYPLLRT